MRKRTLLLLGASGVMALGIAVPVAAAAADDPKPRQQQFASSLAKELGVDEAKVTAALEKLRSEKAGDKAGDKAPDRGERQDLKTRLDAAVKEGKLTQAEADAVLKAVESGVLWSGGGGWHHRGGGDWKGHWNDDKVNNK
jgi:hypothetical protein